MNILFEWFKLGMLYCLPQHLLTRILGILMNCRIHWYKQLLIRWFIRRFKVNLTEAVQTNIHDYKNFSDFFTRALQADKRDLSIRPHHFISPADGTISAMGTFTNNHIFQAKNRYYQASSLLGLSDAQLNNYQLTNGQFITLYLSPKDYHRIHMPLSGTLICTHYIPGKLFSVNPFSAAKVTNLFARNERYVSIFKGTHGGYFAIVMVGAFIVAGIHTQWAGKIAPSRSPVYTKDISQHHNIMLTQGDEMGFFDIGSTVVVLTSPEYSLTWSTEWKPHSSVQLGNNLASITQAEN